MLYDHKEENYCTEEKFSENYISIIKQCFPGSIYYKVRRYTKADPVTKPLQDAHIDYIVLWRGKLILIDFKGINTKNGYADCAILEIFRQYKKNHKLGLIIEGWVKATGEVVVPTEILDDMPEAMRDAIPNGMIDVPASKQYIIRVSEKEFIPFRKDKIKECRIRHPEKFRLNELVYEMDSGNKEENIKKGDIKYDFNMYFYYNNIEDVNYLEEIGAKKYHLCRGKWYQVPIEKLGNR